MVHNTRQTLPLFIGARNSCLTRNRNNNNRMDTRLRMSLAMGIVLLMVALKGEKVSCADNDCINKIVPCAQYVNGTGKPPAVCCDPLLEVINNQLECLCNVLKSNIINSFNITLQEALQLPVRCGKAVDNNACLVGAPSPSVTPSGTTPPPAQSSTTMNSAAAISISTLIGMTLLVSLLDGLRGI